MTSIATNPSTSSFTTPRFSKAFKFTALGLLTAGMIVLLTLGFNAFQKHQSAERIATNKIFYVISGIAQKKDLPNLLTSVSGTQIIDGSAIVSTTQQLPGNNFTLQLATADGWRWAYDSRTGQKQIGCGVKPGCYLGLER